MPQTSPVPGRVFPEHEELLLHAQWNAAQPTQRSHTESQRLRRQSFIKLPSYLIFCHRADMRVIFFIYAADFRGLCIKD